MSMITIRNLQFQYDAAPEINALYGIDLEIRKGECIVLTGESGCGKTTLTRCLNGLIPNFFEGTLTGEILYEGVPVNKLEQYELSRKIGTVFQDPRSQFFAVNTTDEVAFGCENLAFSTERINQNVDAAFSRMNIDVLRDRSLFGLSSGEKQRLAVASIYAMDTDVIVLDEPTANLDGSIRCCSCVAWESVRQCFDHRMGSQLDLGGFSRIFSKTLSIFKINPMLPQGSV